MANKTSPDAHNTSGFGGFGQPPHSEMPPTAVKQRRGPPIMQDAYGNVAPGQPTPVTPPEAPVEPAKEPE